MVREFEDIVAIEDLQGFLAHLAGYEEQFRVEPAVMDCAELDLPAFGCAGWCEDQTAWDGETERVDVIPELAGEIEEAERLLRAGIGEINPFRSGHLHLEISH